MAGAGMRRFSAWHRACDQQGSCRSQEQRSLIQVPGQHAPQPLLAPHLPDQSCCPPLACSCFPPHQARTSAGRGCPMRSMMRGPAWWSLAAAALASDGAQQAERHHLRGMPGLQDAPLPAVMPSAPLFPQQTPGTCGTKPWSPPLTMNCHPLRGATLSPSCRTSTRWRCTAQMQMWCCQMARRLVLLPGCASGSVLTLEAGGSRIPTMLLPTRRSSLLYQRRRRCWTRMGGGMGTGQGTATEHLAERAPGTA
mmetsp:Transcript_35821/g.79725  ORF Transcript_35821/g.79725 Transcript_35821/m.79725 type:complete len:252 (+) Transcript_35821:1106-1861(+)